MKKALLFLLVVAGTFSTIAQGVKFGVQFAPQVSSNRIKDQIEDFQINNSGAGMRFSAGPVLDFYLLENVSFSTGLWFSNKRAAVQFIEDATGFNKQAEYTLHYLQLPVSIKMMVNEIAGTWRPYVQIGTTIDIKISEKLANDVAIQFEQTRNQGFAKFYDLGMLVAIGTEMNVFSSNSVFAAFTYNRGLLNIMKSSYQKEFAKDVTGNEETKLQKDDELQFKNDSYGIMFGFKF